jgi:hypothetical protein
MPDGVAGKSSIVFDCVDVEATVAGRRERGVSVLQQPKVTVGPFAAFGSEGYGHGSRGRLTLV